MCRFDLIQALSLSSSFGVSPPCETSGRRLVTFNFLWKVDAARWREVRRAGQIATFSQTHLKYYVTLAMHRVNGSHKGLSISRTTLGDLRGVKLFRFPFLISFSTMAARRPR